ncbi:MAG: tetratricopeptide (TPR) repeat protein [Glaciecola sp.]|jgi:tetratricopeptide (TPR) repeat protein
MSVTFRFFRSLLSLSFLIFFCSGCTSIDQQRAASIPIEQLLNDSAFTEFGAYSIERPTDIFALDPQAKTFVAETIEGLHSGDERIEALIHRIFARADLDLVYEASANTIASETFKNGSANCLSLSIMTFAMAKEAQLQSDFQIVEIPEYWTRRGGYTLLNGHINLRIKAKTNSNITRLFENVFVVDFDPSAGANKFPTQYASEKVVLAMFYNNKGADALLNENSDLAYAYLREAILADENYAGAWVNLGLLYRKKGLYNLALGAYNQAIALNEDYNTAWENLAILYEHLGDTKAAFDIHTRLDQKRQKNPFYHQMLAEIDRNEGSLENSILHYKKAIGLNNNQHQFYFGLATVYFDKGDFEKSEHYLMLAIRKAGKGNVADMYLNKLSALSSFIASTHSK